MSMVFGIAILLAINNIAYVQAAGDLISLVPIVLSWLLSNILLPFWELYIEHRVTEYQILALEEHLGVLHAELEVIGAQIEENRQATLEFHRGIELKITRASFLRHNFVDSASRTYATMATNLKSYKFMHSMIRVKDPKESVKFYEFLGMKMINKIEQPEAKFDLYFLGYDSPKAVSHANHFTDREGLIELTHNYGTENDPEYKVTTGNAEPFKGFGHFCISVDNIHAACQRLEDAGYKFQKKLTDGRMKHIAFVLDPDGYWVEIISQGDIEKTESIKETDISTYRMNHTMIRVKDHEKSLKFYMEVLGMSLLRTKENKDAKFDLYFLGYPGDKGIPTGPEGAVNPIADREGILELTWNYGTEKDADFKYHNGNDQPQGFGHICVSVDDLDSACQRFEEQGVNWKKRLTDGRMRNVAFVLDPDNYWVEVVQNERLKGRANW